MKLKRFLVTVSHKENLNIGLFSLKLLALSLGFNRKVVSFAGLGKKDFLEKMKAFLCGCGTSAFGVRFGRRASGFGR